MTESRQVDFKCRRGAHFEGGGRDVDLTADEDLLTGEDTFVEVTVRLVLTKAE